MKKKKKLIIEFFKTARLLLIVVAIISCLILVKHSSISYVNKKTQETETTYVIATFDRSEQ